MAVALTLGGSAAADVLTRSTGKWRRLKLALGGITLIAAMLSVAGYVIIKAYATNLTPDETNTAVLFVAGATLVGSFLCELCVEL